MRSLPLPALAAFVAAAIVPLHAEEFPPPKVLTPPAQAGLGIQRTMQLLASSTPEHRKTVRILFYGQSITEQGWTKLVSDYLKTAYPNANLIIENRAIGGHSSQLLVKTAEADLYPFQPDLLIFHVYGAHDKYEDIIRTVRERTCAEVLIQTDHLSADQSVDEPVDQAKLTMKEWAQWFNYVFLPTLHDKYQVDVVPQRELWKQYLRDYQLVPQDLLKDGVHLNARGEYLMAEIVKSQLVVHPEISPPAVKRVKTLPVSPEAWSKEEPPFVLSFEGSRIDGILPATQSSTTQPVTVTIDGKPPSQWPQCFAFTRVSGYNRTSWPCLLRVNFGLQLPLAETWTIALKDANEDYTQFHFTLTGSVTGPDGEGDGTQRFTSKSGRIVIEPEDWNLSFSRKIFKVPHPDDAPITFETRALGVDSFVPGAGTDPHIESTVTLAQNLPPGPHVLKLTGATGATGVSAPFTAFKVYDPRAK